MITIIFAFQMKYHYFIPLCIVLYCVVHVKINKAHSKSMEKFFEEIYDSIKRHINFEVVKVILIGR